MTDKPDPKTIPPHTCHCQPLSPHLVQVPMTRWYDPSQLFNTGVQVAISAALGTRVDERRLEGLFAAEAKNPHDYITREGDEIWFDYAADVGDGFNSTFQIAHLLARPSVQPAGSDKALPRGSFLILGGDEVYPVASWKCYQDKLVGPYAEAWRQAMGEPWGTSSGAPAQVARGAPAGTPPATTGLSPTGAPSTTAGMTLAGTLPATAGLSSTGSTGETHAGSPGRPRARVDLFAVPGNHDWYDGLVSFTRLFCQDPELQPRYLGDWRSAQRRSYFAIKLPHSWWIWAVDIQLEADIDELQLQYFAQRSAELEQGDKVILCVSEPAWIRTPVPGATPPNLDLLREKYIEPRGATLALSLTGDLHHYCHHALEGADRHKIIAGGGGAFLHATHVGNGTGPKLELAEGEFTLKAVFPDAATSKKLGRKIPLLPYYNPTFCYVSAAVYLMLTWGLPKWTYFQDLAPLLDVLLNHEGNLVQQTAVTTWATAIALVWLGRRVAKSEEKRNEKGFRWWGTLHGMLQVGSAWGLHYAFTALFFFMFGSRMEALVPTVLRLGLFAVVGALWGAMLLGLYFYTSLAWFGKHLNDAFAVMHIEHYKNFLRLHIDREGTLTIYPIGVPQVMKHPCEAKPELIEPPIRIPGPARA